MMLTIKCPTCGVDGKMSLVDPNYDGPYKCWSCRALFTLKIHNDTVESCEPLSQEEYDKAHPPKPAINMTIGDTRSSGDDRNTGRSGYRNLF